MPNLTVNQFQECANTAVQKLIALGLRQKDIATRLGVSQAMIGHISGIYVHPDFHVSRRIAEKLEQLASTVRVEQKLAVLQQLPLAVLATCNNEGTAVDETVRQGITQAILMGLSNADGNPSSVVFDLPAGIDGALAKVAYDAWIFVRRNSRGTPPDDADQVHRTRAQIKMLREEVKKMQVAIHETNHLIEDLQRELRDDMSPYSPKAAY